MASIVTIGFNKKAQKVCSTLGMIDTDMQNKEAHGLSEMQQVQNIIVSLFCRISSNACLLQVVSLLKSLSQSIMS